MRQFCNQDHFVDQNVSHLDRHLLLLLACQISGRDGVVLCSFIKDALREPFKNVLAEFVR